MRWKGRRKSTHVIDSRGKKVVGTAGAGVLLNFVGRRFGLKGILIMIVVVGVLWMTGLVDPNMFLGGPASTQSTPYQASPEEQVRFDFVHVVLADTEEAMRAANAIGDDAIQGRTQGKVVPHSFTHGTSEQRMRWFNKGLESGRIEDGDTFSMHYDAL